MNVGDILKLLLQSPVIAAVVVGIFTVASIRLGLGRFRSERWWERKAAAYAAAIEGLHGMYDLYKARADAEDAGANLIEEWEKKLHEGDMLGWMEVRKGASIGSFVMTKRAASILDGVMKKLDELDSDRVDPYSELRERVRILSDAIIAMKVEAKADLQT